jgi:hypothetical protein
VKNIATAAVLAFAIGGAVSAQNAATAGSDQGVATGLGDLEKTIFACPKAALNAAAREVTKYPSQGTYQFSYFNIVSASHHAAYEVHFKSNYAAEPVLQFCVAVYCQQGFDPSTTTSVALIGSNAAGGAGHASNACRIGRASATRAPAR